MNVISIGSLGWSFALLLAPVLIAVAYVLTLLTSPLLKTTAKPFRWTRIPLFAPRSLAGALTLLVLDGVFAGSFLISMLVCPVWFLVSILKNTIQRPGLGIGLLRITIPVLTLGFLLGNSHLQSRIARANAERLITACEQYRAAHGDYPSNLNYLVPQYLESVPRAKYCMMGEFFYSGTVGLHTLWWVEVPGFGRL